MKKISYNIDWSGRALRYTDEEIQAVVNVMRDADPLSQGKHLKKFEEDFGTYNGMTNCYACSNCANALDIIALLCRIRAGDEVIVPAHTYCASAIPFARAGAKLVWADIDPETRLISYESICANLTLRTKAIVVVHLYGLMAEMDKISDLAKQRGCLLVEDCAQALGAEFKGVKAGSFGDFSAWSFQAQKNITTLGEGGMLRIKSPELAGRVPGLRHNGHSPYAADRQCYWIPAMTNVDMDLDGVWPSNFSISEAQCALGSALLKRIDAINQARIDRAEQFRKAVEGFPELSFQKKPADCKHVYHLLSAKYEGRAFGKHRDEFIRMMAYEFGIKVIVQYYPLYRYPLFQKMGFGGHNCPHTDEFFDSMVSFPFHLWMSDQQFDFMIDCTLKTLRRLRNLN